MRHGNTPTVTPPPLPPPPPPPPSSPPGLKGCDKGGGKEQLALKGRHNDGNKGGDKGGGTGSDNGDKGSNKGGNKGGDKGGEGSNDGNNGGSKGGDKIWQRLADGRNIWQNWNAMAASDRCADPKWDAMAEHHAMARHHARHKHDDPPRTRNQSTSISGDTMFDMSGIMVLFTNGIWILMAMRRTS